MFTQNIIKKPFVVDITDEGHLILYDMTHFYCVIFSIYHTMVVNVESSSRISYISYLKKNEHMILCKCTKNSRISIPQLRAAIFIMISLFYIDLVSFYTLK